MAHGLTMTTVPRLRVGVRLEVDPVRHAAVLLCPEGVLVLNDTAGAMSVCGLLADLAERRLVAFDEAARATPRRREKPAVGEVGGGVPPPPDPVPVGLLAELTHRCPLRCTYCSRPPPGRRLVRSAAVDAAAGHVPAGASRNHRILWRRRSVEPEPLSRAEFAATLHALTARY